MHTYLSTIFKSLQAQQLPALLNILAKTQQHAKDAGMADADLLERRLIEDMHPLHWQVQTVLELSLRSLARLTEQDLPSLEFEEISFDGILAQSKDVIARIAEYDLSVVDANTNKMFEIPIGPEAKLDLSGEDYVLKFYLPNLYFHLTTAYNLARAAGVPIGKLDFMGPVFP